MKKSFPIFVLSLLMFFSACQKDSSEPDAQPTEGKFTTGSFIDIADVQIGVGGGVIEWDNQSGDFGGLTIEIPDEAYDHPVRHQVSFAEIEKSSFNDLIDPITPLIWVNNSETPSERPIEITLKVSVPETDIIGAFYYEEDPGELHGIPVISRTSDEVKIKVWHFSGIVLSKVQRSEIEKEGTFYLPFDLKKNYWGFGNFLTYLGQGGMCTGMSLGAMYLYGKEELKDGFDRLLDNDPTLFLTPNIPEDDVVGIRFASMLQRRYSNFMQFTYNHEYQDAPAAFWSTAYYLKYKKRPLIMVLSGPAQGNHAVIATGYSASDSKNGKIRIVDPNFYPSINRELELKNNEFQKYYSALNLADLKAGKSYEFNDFNLFPFYKFKFKEVTEIWNLARTGGESTTYETYPKITYFAHDADDPKAPKVPLRDLLTGDDNLLPFKHATFSAADQNGSLQLTLFSHYGTDAGKLTYEDPLASNKVFDLGSDDLFIGLGAWTNTSEDYERRWWTDFKWFTVRYSGIEIYTIDPGGTPIETPGKLNVPYHFRVRETANFPSNAEYIWHFADDGSEQTSSNAGVNHTFTKEGLFTISVTIKNSSGEILGRGSATATIEDVYIPQYSLYLSDNGELVFGYNSFIGLEYKIWANKSKRTPDASENLKFVWDFGDGTTQEVINNDTVSKIYYTKPDRRIKCTLYDIDTGKKVGEDSSSAVPKLISIPDEVLPNTKNSFNFALLGSFTYNRENYAIQVFRYYPSPENVEVQIDRSGFRYTSYGLVLEGSFNEYMTAMTHVKLVVDRPDSGKKVYESFEANNIPFLRSNNSLNELSYGLGSPIDKNAHNITVEHRHYESVIDDWIEMTGVNWEKAIFSLKLN